MKCNRILKPVAKTAVKPIPVISAKPQGIKGQIRRAIYVYFLPRFGDDTNNCTNEIMDYIESMDEQEKAAALGNLTWLEILNKGIKSGKITDYTKD